MSTRIALFLCLALGILAPHARAELPDDYYEAVKSSAAIVGGDGRFVIGLGRSPEPVVGYLKRSRPGSAASLPLTGFRYLPGGAHALVAEGMEDMYRPLTSVEETALFAHLDRTFPSDETLKGREVNLIDYGQRADTLFSMHFYLERYLAARNRKVKVTLTVLTNPLFVKDLKKRSALLKVPITIVPLHESGFRAALDRGVNEYSASFGAYRIADMVAGKLPPPNDNSEFEEALQLSMKEIGGHPKPKARSWWCRHFLKYLGW